MKKQMIVLITAIMLISPLILSICSVNAAAPGTFSIINPGPESNPSKWNASSTVRNFNTSDLIFYSNESSYGSTFFVNITVSNVTQLWAWGIGITFDNTTLAFVDAFLPADHVFAGAVDAGRVLVPTPEIVEPSTGPNRWILKWGVSFIPDEANPWSFNGTGVLGQVQFKIVSKVGSGNAQAESTLEWDLDWTSMFIWPSSETEVPEAIPASFAYHYVAPFETTPPTIGTPVQTPAGTAIEPLTDVSVSVNVTDADSGVQNVTLWYTNDTVFYGVPMEHSTGDTYTGVIPGFPANTNVTYKIAAYDIAGNLATQDNNSVLFKFTFIPEFAVVTLAVVFSSLSLLAAAASISRKRRI